jgi:predicted transposase/invertase (TIGR01784 family)
MLAETMSTWFKEAEDKGIEKGIEQGIEKGREEGREEGMLQTAGVMKKKGLSIETIIDCTGLTKEQIEKL